MKENEQQRGKPHPRERHGAQAMLNHVKLVTLETCQVYGMRTIFVIDANLVVEDMGLAPPGKAAS